MTRWRHLGLVSLSALPLLVVGLVLVAGRDLPQAWTVLLWALGVLVLDTVLWRTISAPFQDTLRELDARTPEEARWLARDLKNNSQLCQADRSRMSELVADLSSSLGEGLVLVDQELKIRLMNNVALRFCGVDRVRPDTHLLELLRDPGVVEVFEGAAEGRQPGPVVVENPRGLWEVRAFPVGDGGAVGLLSDVSLIRRASEFRRRFVQDLSHELRSPLTVMRTTVEALEGEVTAELAEMLVRQVDRVDRLATELNDLASIEAGHVELDLRSVSVQEVVGEVVDDFRPEAERAGVTVDTDVVDGLHCWCDRRGLYRVLSNLIDNAVKYNRRDGWVRVKGSLAADFVSLQVADSGQGIPAGELQAVLQRFYRVDRARTPGQGGLGLGLAIVKHMVQHMGGRLALDSREGVGTTVRIELPARDPGSGSAL
jgi:signal transduction histidine kinase